MSLLQVFGSFKDQLDDHYDRRERLIKLSRDITALSKKWIFTLHRVPIVPTTQHSDVIPEELLKDIAKHRQQIEALVDKAKTELQNSNTWRYQRNISPGVQEFVEALTFQYYIEHQRIPTYESTQELLGSVYLTPADYVLGVADLTGELARRAIAALSQSEPAALAYTTRIATCLRHLVAEFEALDAGRDAEGLRELEKKISVMQSSVKKVELGLFEKCVRRGTERPGQCASETRED